MVKKCCKNSNSFHEGEASFASNYTRIQEIVSKEICFSGALCRPESDFDTKMEGRFSCPARHEREDACRSIKSHKAKEH